MSNQLQMLMEVNDEHDDNVLTTINESAPSLATGAMLVEMSTGVWSGRKKDHEASKQVNEQAGADANVASVHKALLGKCAELEAVKSHLGWTRNHVHYALTPPWANNGDRFLTTAIYLEKYHKTMTEAQAEFDRLVNVFLDAYDWEVTQAQVKLGTLFDADEYPTRDEVASKFYFDIYYKPLPDAGDVRVDVGNEQKAYLSDSYKKYYDDRYNGMMQHLWEQLLKPLANMSEKLDFAEGEDKRKFKNTLVDNVLDVVEVMRLTNINKDTHMTAVADKLEDALRHVTPEALREDGALRHNTKKVADDVMQQINNLPSIF